MTNGYQPPQMPPYPQSMAELYQVIAPYYDEQRPLDLFFELLVIDIVGALPEATDKAIQELVSEHPAFFASAGGEWRRGVRSDLHLSDTFDIAVLDLWYRNGERAKQDGWSYHPWHFAQNFLDNYMADGSRIDVWEGDSLQQAKARIQAVRGSS